MDVVDIFAKLTRGQGHNMDRAQRALFNFLKKQGFDKSQLDVPRKNIPKYEEGFDVKVAREEQIITSWRGVSTPQKKFES